MTLQLVKPNPPPRDLWRSIAAVFLGFVAVVVLSLGTDQLMHVFDVYPPWGEPMNDFGDNLLALSYRCIYGVIGSYITARLAPYSPMRHLWIGAGIGFVLSLFGVIAALNMNWGRSGIPSHSRLQHCPVPGWAACYIANLKLGGTKLCYDKQ